MYKHRKGGGQICLMDLMVAIFSTSTFGYHHLLCHLPLQYKSFLPHPAILNMWNEWLCTCSDSSPLMFDYKCRMISSRVTYARCTYLYCKTLLCPHVECSFLISCVIMDNFLYLFHDGLESWITQCLNVHLNTNTQLFWHFIYLIIGFEQRVFTIS